IWPKDLPKARAMRERLRRDRCDELPARREGIVRLKGLSSLAEFVARAEPELVANAMICAIHQATYLLRRQVESQAREFSNKGGFTENLYLTRTRSRRR
ncbi:MAG: hypothetical protein JSU96_01625, partial [Acidobacteriota bacterium]